MLVPGARFGWWRLSLAWGMLVGMTGCRVDLPPDGGMPDIEAGRPGLDGGRPEAESGVLLPDVGMPDGLPPVPPDASAIEAGRGDARREASIDDGHAQPEGSGGLDAARDASDPPGDATEPPLDATDPPGDGGADTGPLPRPCDEAVYGYRVVHEYPHDSKAFTEGLLYEDGFLLEGTGLEGQSDIRQVDLVSGKVMRSASLSKAYFGEGITTWGDRLIQLTYKTKTGFVYDKATFSQTASFSYPTEGWGLTHDDKRLIMSDGTEKLYFLDPNTFANVGSVTVQAKTGPVTNINELEYIEGRVLANIWYSKRIAEIDPGTGRVCSWIDLSGIIKDSDCTESLDVLNGIAWDAAQRRLFVTGKYWCKLFEIEITTAQ